MALNAPDVPEQPIPSIRVQPTATLDTFGGGPGLEAEGQQIQKIAASGGEIAAFEKIKADQGAYEDAANKLTDFSSQIVSEAQRSQGLNAISAHDKAIEAIRKKANEIAGTLHGEQQIGAFNKYARTHDSEINRTLNAHVSDQMEKHYDKTADAFIKNTTEFAAKNYGDPATRQRSLQSINNAIDGYASRKGMDDEQKKLMRSNIISNFHEQTIDMMLNDPKAAPLAKQYYSENKDDIDTATRERLQASLSEGDTRYASQSEVQRILQKYPDSEADALRAADKIDDADMRDMARQMISTKFSQNRQARKNDADSSFMDNLENLNKKGITDPVERRNAVPVKDWNKLSPEQQRAIEKGGSSDVTSMPVWADFTEAVKDGSISKMTRADIFSKFIPHMKPEDQKTVIEVWSLGQKGVSAPKFQSIQSNEQALDAAASASGLIPASAKNRTSRDVLVLKKLQDNVGRDMDQFQMSVGRPPNPKEKQEIRDKRMIEAIGNKPGGLFSRQGGPVAFEAIPEQARSQAVQLARSGGWTPTRQNIEKAYQMHKQGKTDAEITRALK